MSIDRALNIHIGTTSDTKGVDETKTSFGQLGEKIKENYDGTGKLEGAHHKLREGMNLIAENAAPGMGRALFAATEGPIGIALAAGLAFSFLKEKIAESNKELDEMGEKLAEHFGNMAEALADANRKIAATAEEAASALHKVEAAEKAIKERTDETTEAVRRKEQAQVAINDAQEALALARVDAERKLGLDPEEAALKEAQIKIAAEQRRNQLANAADTGAANTKANELDNKRVLQRELEQMVSEGSKGEAHRIAKLDAKNGLPAELAGLESQKEELDKQIKAQKKAAESAQDKTETLKAAHRSLGVGTDEDIEASQANADKEKQKAEDLESQAKRYAMAIESNKREQEKFTTEQKNYEDAKTALTKAKDAIHELQLEAEKLFNVARENASQRSNLSGIHAETEITHALPGLVNNAGALAGASSQNLTSLTKLLQDVADTQATTTHAVATTHGWVEQQQRDIQQLADAIDSARQRADTQNLNHIK